MLRAGPGYVKKRPNRVANMAKLEMEDVEFMREALLEARRASDQGEVPVGAVVVRGGETLIFVFRCHLEADKRPTQIEEPQQDIKYGQTWP